MSKALKYKDLTLHIDVSFWYELERKKLEEWKLDEPEVPLTVWIPSVSKLGHQQAGQVTLSAESFNVGKRLTHMNNIPCLLRNFNTPDQLQDLKKKEALEAECRKLESSIVSGAATAGGAGSADEASGSMLTLVLWTFSDLKTHKFSYIAAFPTLALAAEHAVSGSGIVAAKTKPEQVRAAKDFIVQNEATAVGTSPIVFTQASGNTPMPLNNKNLSNDSKDVVVGVLDTSEMAEHPSWPLRNVVTAVRLLAPKLAEFTVLLVANDPELRKTHLENPEDAQVAEIHCTCAPQDDTAAISANLKFVGWVEKSIQSVEMGSMMDPKLLADSSANLNLGLMKWRMMPGIQLDGIKNCKVLLLGSGTLGCNVARHLMMWGVRTITFVDRGNVSYSNPVRQSLFELSDVIADGDLKVKSIAAANTVKRILPTMNATGVQLTIRMPGHRVDEKNRDSAVADILKLEQLIKDHDVIYLLTDSRESRWLPTVLSVAHDKPVINSALGFDTWMVMRHGMRAQGKDRCGCYFCNDVVAPLDSLTARTLDQQCTVTRPGVSAVASSLAVEVLAAMYNHKDGFLAPAHKVSSEDDQGENPAEGVLGIVPHQIRGSVNDYSSMTLHGPNYTMCTACSDTIVDAYKKEGVDFIIKCLNEPAYMEEITGLKAEREKMQEKFANWDDDEFDDEFDE